MVRLVDAVNLDRSVYYRWKKTKPALDRRVGRTPANKLAEAEQQRLLELLHDEAYVDQTPFQCFWKWIPIYGYLASISTLYRLLRAQKELVWRGRQRLRLQRKAPVVYAEAVHEVWCWDITLLPGPRKGQFYYLYAIIDLFSRYLVGWTVSERERAETAQDFLREAFRREQERVKRLVIHSDRGNPMVAKETRRMLESLRVQVSYGRPRVSDDNPFIESFFKRVKYDPSYPECFQGLDAVKRWFSTWLEAYHHTPHRGLKGLTPAQIISGEVDGVVERYTMARWAKASTNPERFSGRMAELALPQRVGINLHSLKELYESKKEAKLPSAGPGPASGPGDGLPGTQESHGLGGATQGIEAAVFVAP